MHIFMSKLFINLCEITLKQYETRIITDEIFRKVIFNMYFTHNILNGLIKIGFVCTNSILTEIQVASRALLKNDRKFVVYKDYSEDV